MPVPRVHLNPGLMTTQPVRGHDAFDRALIARIGSGDERAVGELYDRLGPAAWNLACALTDSPANAEAVVADAFARVWREARGFPPSGTGTGVLAWLLGMVRSCCRSRRCRETDYARIVARLPDQQRHMLELSWFGGLTVHQIAYELEESHASVLNQLRSALESARGALPRPIRFGEPQVSRA